MQKQLQGNSFGVCKVAGHQHLLVVSGRSKSFSVCSKLFAHYRDSLGLCWCMACDVRAHAALWVVVKVAEGEKRLQSNIFMLALHMVLQKGGVLVLRVFSLFATCRLVLAAWEELNGLGPLHMGCLLFWQCRSVQHSHAF